MKIVAYTHYENERKRIEGIAREAGFEVGEKPDFVITYGGDGTILEAERTYASVPKIPVRKIEIKSRCKNYSLEELGEILGKIKGKEYKVEEWAKVGGEVNGKKLVGLNEIQVHNKNPSQALRFMVYADGKPLEVIGDGVVVATPYGSTAYYHALGYKPFDKGLRAGFNNTIPKIGYLEVKDIVEVKILREDGLVIADNDSNMIQVAQGDLIRIRQSKEKARFVSV